MLGIVEESFENVYWEEINRREEVTPMAETPSTMAPLGTKMPPFELPDPDGTVYSSDQYAGKPLLVIFMCNHCPFVKHLVDKLAERAKEYQQMGVSVVGIMPNDLTDHPEDGPEYMKSFAKEHGMDFPYLFDESQEVAKRFQAACTPDFFLFDSNHTLVYRGQFDSSRPGNDESVTGNDLTAAVRNLVEGKEIPDKQTPSVGCNIKWKPGNEPGYFKAV